MCVGQCVCVNIYDKLYVYVCAGTRWTKKAEHFCVSEFLALPEQKNEFAKTFTEFAAIKCEKLIAERLRKTMSNSIESENACVLCMAYKYIDFST